MSSANELPIIHNFIMQLEEYINRNGLCSRAEYPFNIIGETSLNLSPLGITENQLIAFCQKIRANQGNLDATFSNYLKALNNSSLLKIINDTATTNAFFVMVMYMHNPLHMEIVTIKDPEELLYDLQTPDEVKELITDQDGIYYNLLNLDSDKDESDSYSSEEDYHYSDL
jgi:hypothetical protein